MSLVHVGVRPKYKLTLENCKDEVKRRYKGCYYEHLPDGGFKVWTSRMLASGCNKVLDDIVRKYKLIYCPHCDEFFSKDQFKESEE